jgi:hypothetical protein
MATEIGMHGRALRTGGIGNRDSVADTPAWAKEEPEDADEVEARRERARKRHMEREMERQVATAQEDVEEEEEEEETKQLESESEWETDSEDENTVWLSLLLQPALLGPHACCTVPDAHALP